MRIDVHQHLLTERLCSALAARTEAPRLRSVADGWVLELANEAPTELGRLPADPDARAAALGDEGVDMALVALSAALGVEALPGDQARAVIDAWHADAEDLPPRLVAWGSIPLADAGPADVDAALTAGRAGLCLPAEALGDPGALDRIGPLLDRLEEAGAPLFVHPGPAPAGSWLPALTTYVSALSAAWLTWAVRGRAAHPQLRVVFAALAGLAPLHADRLAARFSPDAARDALADDRTFLDTSSYGPQVLAAVVRAAGPGTLVHGSDWPYAQGRLPGASLDRAVLELNPAALLHGAAVVAA